MKKSIIFVLTSILALGCLLILASCNKDPSCNEVEVSYVAEYGGEITGLATQTVLCGGQTTEVEAVPLRGFSFAGWSDGVNSAIRHDENITSNQTFTAKFEKLQYNICYKAAENGTIEGEQTQVVKYRETTRTVQAVPNEGYRFVMWSDGKIVKKRNDIVYGNLTITAYFEEIAYIFHYDYGMATGNCSEESVNVLYHNFSDVSFIVPEREHFRFKGWYLGEKQISNELGDATIEPSELSNDKEPILTAKWEPIETFTYKILLVYVQELSGTFLSRDSTQKIEVNYKMNDIEHRICELTTIQVEHKLNEMMDGMVQFEVDEYFTEVPINSATHSMALYRDLSRDIVLDPSELPELKDMMKSYESTLATFCLNDFNNKLKGCNGYAWEDRGAVYFENFFFNEPIEDFFDLNHYKWENIVSTYVHEFIHTIEQKDAVFLYNERKMYYHDALHQYLEKELIKFPVDNEPCDLEHWTLYFGRLNDEINKAFLFQRAQLNGKYVGVPYEFWKKSKRYEK